MRRSQFTIEQIATALGQAESGTPVAEACWKLKITEAPFYRWKKPFGGMGTSELRQLEEENRKLKHFMGRAAIEDGFQKSYSCDRSIIRSVSHPHSQAFSVA